MLLFVSHILLLKARLICGGCMRRPGGELHSHGRSKSTPFRPPSAERQRHRGPRGGWNLGFADSPGNLAATLSEGRDCVSEASALTSVLNFSTPCVVRMTHGCSPTHRNNDVLCWTTCRAKPLSGPVPFCAWHSAHMGPKQLHAKWARCRADRRRSADVHAFCGRRRNGVQGDARLPSRGSGGSPNLSRV